MSASGRFKRLARLNGSGDQYGALAWRRHDGAAQVLLITSRETRRWTIPKGWPDKRLSPADAAAREAHEEAGVSGPTGQALGAYRYDKRLRDGTVVLLTVTVFPLAVEQTLDHWPEERERERLWIAPDRAAALVAEPELKALILGFEPGG